VQPCIHLPVEHDALVSRVRMAYLVVDVRTLARHVRNQEFTRLDLVENAVGDPAVVLDVVGGDRMNAELLAEQRFRSS